MKECFVTKRFSPARLEMIEQANVILSDYARQGWKVTLRQLHYQFVSRAIRIGGMLYENTQQSYKRLGDILTDARLAGLVDWDYIEDRGRDVIYPPHWSNPGEIARACVHQFRIDRWEGQENRIVVMVEKDALSGVLEPVCDELDVRLIANKGYSSASAMYEHGNLIERWILDSHSVWVLYLGDHDPSGIQMTEDVQNRIGLLARAQEEIGFQLHVNRLALNWEQVERYNPPVNPVKLTDSRANTYIDRYGEDCWELDAIEPGVLAGLVRRAILDLRDQDPWDFALEKERVMKAELQKFADQYRD